MVFSDIIDYAALTGKLLLFLVNAVGLELVLWTYVANRYTRLNRKFMLAAFYVLAWVDLDSASALAPVFFPENAAHAAALWATRAVYALMAVFFASFYSYCLNFPVRNPLDKSRRRRENLQVALWAFFFVASFTPFVVADVVFDPILPLAVWVKAGPLFLVYVAAAVLTLARSFSNLSRNRRVADARNREIARLAGLGAGVFAVFNLIFNIAGTVFGGALGYGGFFSLYADYAIAVLLGYLAYQAVRDQLFGIKVILVEIFVGLMGASLFTMPFFVNFLWQQVLLIALFLLFCGFGYLLVRSTIKEYREKELLEQKVRERTQELERAKQNLEEMNSVLEIRVKARTRELEKLNRTLEEKVVERTNDLETKIKDLETFQRLTVGHQLKMIELKKELEQMRAAVS